MDSWFKREERFPCPPDMNEIRKDMELFRDDYEDEEDMEETENVVSCVEDYLNLYNMFTTGNPPEDNLIKEMYKKTTKMIDKARESREYQRDIVKDKLRDYENILATNCDEEDESPFCSEVKDAVFYGRELLKSFDYDFEVLKDLKDYCKAANTNTSISFCIERFVNTAHERGPYIPIGCGGHLPEALSPRLEEDEELPLIQNITLELEKETKRVLNCLRNYKP